MFRWISSRCAVVTRLNPPSHHAMSVSRSTGKSVSPDRPASWELGEPGPRQRARRVEQLAHALMSRSPGSRFLRCSRSCPNRSCGHGVGIGLRHEAMSEPTSPMPTCDDNAVPFEQKRGGAAGALPDMFRRRQVRDGVAQRICRRRARRRCRYGHRTPRRSHAPTMGSSPGRAALRRPPRRAAGVRSYPSSTPLARMICSSTSRGSNSTMSRTSWVSRFSRRQSRALKHRLTQQDLGLALNKPAEPDDSSRWPGDAHRPDDHAVEHDRHRDAGQTPINAAASSASWLAATPLRTTATEASWIEPTREMSPLPMTCAFWSVISTLCPRMCVVSSAISAASSGVSTPGSMATS